MEALNKVLNEAGIPAIIENTGGGVMACAVRTYEGEFLVGYSEEDSSSFNLGLFDAFGEIESSYEISLADVVARIKKAL